MNGEDLIFSVWLAAGGKRRELLGHFDARHREESVVEFTRPFERGETIIIAPWRMAKVRSDDAGYSIYLPDKQEKIPEGGTSSTTPILHPHSGTGNRGEASRLPDHFTKYGLLRAPFTVR